ncbi:MAG: hypothetical protein ACQGVC_02145 [Myxococcota bacterium]
MAEGQADRRGKGGSVRRGRATALGTLALCLTAAAPAGAADPCAPWPGEPDPLPRVDADDEMLARWAELRARELSDAARDLEPVAPLRANHLWRRVLCLDPGSDAAVAGLARTPLAAVHQPALVTRAADATDADVWAALDLPVRVRLPQPEPTPAATPQPAAPTPSAFDSGVAELEAQVRSARFEEALAGADAVAASAENGEQAARAQVLAATAALALGREADADAHFRRALSADPGLTLDPMTTSPKVRRAFDRVREARP